jgi:hypothetical protein
MLLGRGVCAVFDADEAWKHHCTVLRVERRGKFSIIKTGLTLDYGLLFVGSATDRFAVASFARAVYAPGLVLFDFEEGVCDFLHGFSQRALKCYCSSVSSLACSGSGSTIAAVVSESSCGLCSVHILSVDVTARVVHSTRIIPCEWMTRDCPIVPLVQVCFVGPCGSALIAVHGGTGNVVQLGREQRNSIMGFEAAQAMPLLKRLLDDDGGRLLDDNDNDDDDDDVWDEIVSVACVHGTSTVLALVRHHTDESTDDQAASWGVVEASLDQPHVTGAFVRDNWQGVPEAIYHETGTGVVIVHKDGKSGVECMRYTLFSKWYSMKLGVMRQCWMEACLRAAVQQGIK